MLEFIRQRDRKEKPKPEEKQILDGIKIILENDWLVATDELLEFFNLIDLRSKHNAVTPDVQIEKFLKMLCKEFDLDELPIDAYFGRHRHALQFASAPIS